MDVPIVLAPGSRLPTRGSAGAAGYDLCALVGGTVAAGCQQLVDTGVKLSIPSGYYGYIASRSGLAYKYRIEAFSGVIDEDYTGNIGIILRNFGNEDFSWDAGDRLAQLLIVKYNTVNFDVMDALKPTVRNVGGFGSTGIKQHQNAE